jgi:hypothetical protein
LVESLRNLHKGLLEHALAEKFIKLLYANFVFAHQLLSNLLRDHLPSLIAIQGNTLPHQEVKEHWQRQFSHFIGVRLNLFVQIFPTKLDPNRLDTFGLLSQTVAIGLGRLHLLARFACESNGRRITDLCVGALGLTEGDLLPSVFLNFVLNFAIARCFLLFHLNFMSLSQLVFVPNLEV